MEVTPFKDEIRFNRMYMPSVPPEETRSIGDAAYAGKNVVASPYGQPISWRGASIVNQPATPLLQLVGTLLGGLTRGNIVLGPGGSYWFIGSGAAYVDDFSTALGVASALLQLNFQGATYQGGLPAPSAPLLQIATDSAGNAITGQRKGTSSAVLTRRRTSTGTETAASLPSNVLTLNSNQVRVTFPAASAAAGQDAWGIYFTRNGFGGEGPHFLLREVAESEIAPTLGLGIGTATGGLAAYTALSNVATNGRASALALAPSGGSAPVLRGVAVARSAGNATTLRLSKPQAAQDGDFLIVALAANHTHKINPGGANKGTVAPTVITGAWTLAGSIGNPNGETVELEQISTTQFRWRLGSSGVWSAGTALSTSPTALGTTGLAVTWSAASSSVDEINNTFSIEPMGIVAPTGWTLEHLVAATTDNRALAIYTRRSVVGDASFEDFNTTAAAQLFGTLTAYQDVASVTPVAARATNTTTAATSHTVTFGGATTGTQAVVTHFTGAGDITWSPSAPLTLAVNSAASARTLDFNFSDDELLEVIALRNVEPPPAGTHCFVLGPVMIVAGSLDGTALSPSLPNQFELYDLANTVYLNPTEPIMRVDSRPHDGSLYIWTRNSLQTVILTGEPDLPIISRAVWAQTGIGNPSGAALTPRRAYAYSARGGPVRTAGSNTPDDSFAKPILSYVRDWRAEETVVGYDSRNLGMVAYCNGRTILIYFEDFGLWSLPLFVDDFYYSIRVAVYDGDITAGTKVLTSASNRWQPGDVGKHLSVVGAGPGGGVLDTIIETFINPGQVLLHDAASVTVTGATTTWGADVSQVRIMSAATVDGRLYLSIGDEAYSQLYEFNCGVGTEWAIRSVPRDGGAVGHKKTIKNARVLANFDSKVALSYRRLSGLRHDMGRLYAESGAVGGYAVADVFTSMNQLHGTSVYWEWNLLAPLMKDRGMVFNVASALYPYGLPSPLSTMDYTACQFGWRVKADGNLYVYRYGVEQTNFGGLVAAGDRVRCEVAPDQDWMIRWYDAAGNLKAEKEYAASPFGATINEPLGVKAIITDPGGQLETGRTGRVGQTGCLNLYANYGDETPDRTWEYAPDGLTEYPWHKINLRAGVFQAEVCGVGAEQSPARVLVDGHHRPDHL